MWLAEYVDSRSKLVYNLSSKHWIWWDELNGNKEGLNSRVHMLRSESIRKSGNLLWPWKHVILKRLTDLWVIFLYNMFFFFPDWSDFHPSIIYTHLLLLSSLMEPVPANFRWKAEVHPGQSLILVVNLGSPVNLTCMFLGCERKAQASMWKKLPAGRI